MFTIKKYIQDSLYIIKTTTIVLWFIVIVGAISSINSRYPESSLFWPITIVTSVLSLVSLPVIYGIYFELIEDTYSSIGEIAKKYIGRYIWLLFNMYMPVILIATLPSLIMPELGGGGSFQLTIVSFSLLYLYIVPWFYVSGDIRGSITEGIHFLIKNLSASTPLIFMTLIAESLLLLFQYNKNLFSGLHTALFVVLDAGVFISASIVDYVVFIVLIFIIKSEKDRQNPQLDDEQDD
ncbi:MAG: hypothetical protein GY707_00390 [Desulfobacteraceae bacterium]|nr:hypothetical protein [Desulfobacteraceae bacterium]